MISNIVTCRIRYEEVDRMGFLHHGKYAAYFEIGRTELIRSIGLSYKDLEDKGYQLPLADFHVEFKRPALYDQLISVKTELKDFTGLRLKFHYTIYNEMKQTLCIGYTTLAFVNAETKRPVRPPDFFTELLRLHSSRDQAQV